MAIDATKVQQFFFKSKAGVFILFALLMIVVLTLLVSRQRHGEVANNGGVTVVPTPPPPNPDSGKVREVRRQTSGTSTTVFRPPPTPTPPPPMYVQTTPPPAPVATPTPAQQAPQLPLRIGFFDHPIVPKATPSPTPTVEDRLAARGEEPAGATPSPIRQISEQFLPFGTLIKCSTVMTVDSANLETPIIGLVTENCWHNGQLIVPAGTQVHGNAQNGSGIYERIATGERWVLVFPSDRNGQRVNGSELTVKAVALDRAEKGTDGQHWAIEDGAYGLHGYTIDNNDINYIKKFLATFISAGSAGLQSTQNQATGIGGTISTVQNTPRNAALGGLTAVLADEAASIQREIEKNGAYTRVPGGTQFYLYIQQTMDASDARVGDSLAYNTGAPNQRDQGNDTSRTLRNALDNNRRSVTNAANTAGYQGNRNGQAVVPGEYSSNGGYGQALPNGGYAQPYYANPGSRGVGSTYSYPTGTIPTSDYQRQFPNPNANNAAASQDALPAQ